MDKTLNRRRGCSITVYMCGVVVMCVSQQATCSRVGVPNMAAEMAVRSSHNVRRIAETWFSRRKHLIYRIKFNRLDGPPAATATATSGDEGGRSTVIPAQRKCRHVDWYLSNVASSVMSSPSTSDPLHFGVLQVSVICQYIGYLSLRSLCTVLYALYSIHTHTHTHTYTHTHTHTYTHTGRERERERDRERPRTYYSEAKF